MSHNLSQVSDPKRELLSEIRVGSVNKLESCRQPFTRTDVRRLLLKV